MNSTTDGGAALITLIIILSIYFLPTLVGAIRGHRQTLAIFMTNLLLGWTALGWVAALIWACTTSQAEKVIIVQQGETKR